MSPEKAMQYSLEELDAVSQGERSMRRRTAENVGWNTCGRASRMLSHPRR